MEKLRQNYKKILAAALLVLIIGIAVHISRPLMFLLADTDRFHNMIQSRGPWSRLMLVGLICLQIIVAFIPGEPLEIGAGYAFGPVEGTLLCMAGRLLGSLIVFVIVKTVGKRILYVFFSKEDVEKAAFLNNEKKLCSVLFMIFLIPGTPKDILSYFAPLTKIKLANWIFISTFARIPSIVTSTVGGSALGDKNYIFAAAVFAATALVSLLGLYIYNKKSAGKV